MSAPLTPERFAAARHAVVSRRGQFTGPVDDALETLGLTREIVAVVPGFPDALRIARQSDLVALVTQSCLSDPWFEEGLVSFPLPVETPEIAVVELWHPRMEADPAHRWLRETVIAVCRSSAPSSKPEDNGGAAESASHVRHNKNDRQPT